MSAVTTNAVAAMTGGPPSSSASAAGLPRPAHGGHPARVRVVGRDGLGQRGLRGTDAQPFALHPRDDAGHRGQPGEVGGAVAHQPHRGERRGELAAVAAHGDRVERDVDVDGGQAERRASGASSPRSPPRARRCPAAPRPTRMQTSSTCCTCASEGTAGPTGRSSSAVGGPPRNRSCASRRTAPRNLRVSRSIQGSVADALPSRQAACCWRSISRTASSRDAARRRRRPTCVVRSAPAGTTATPRRWPRR